MALPSGVCLCHANCLAVSLLPRELWLTVLGCFAPLAFHTRLPCLATRPCALLFLPCLSCASTSPTRSSRQPSTRRGRPPACPSVLHPSHVCASTRVAPILGDLPRGDGGECRGGVPALGVKSCPPVRPLAPPHLCSAMPSERAGRQRRGGRHERDRQPGGTETVFSLFVSCHINNLFVRVRVPLWQVIELIEGKPSGILSILNEECVVPKVYPALRTPNRTHSNPSPFRPLTPCVHGAQGSDASFADKLFAQCAWHPVNLPASVPYAPCPYCQQVCIQQAAQAAAQEKGRVPDIALRRAGPSDSNRPIHISPRLAHAFLFANR